MSAVVFLMVFVVLSLFGGLVLWWRERGPRSMEAHMREFERQREALSPGPLPAKRRRSAPSPHLRGPRSG
jgi:hypothetical protein